MTVHDHRRVKAAATPALPDFDEVIAHGGHVGFNPDHGLLAAEPEGYRLIIGDSGRGKGTSFLIPMRLPRQHGRSGAARKTS